MSAKRDAANLRTRGCDDEAAAAHMYHRREAGLIIDQIIVPPRSDQPA
ncbi:hypothetical protein [Actinacidiphila sp. bgisy160]